MKETKVTEKTLEGVLACAGFAKVIAKHLPEGNQEERERRAAIIASKALTTPFKTPEDFANFLIQEGVNLD